LAAAWLAVFAACGARTAFPPPETEYVLGTACRIHLYEDGKPALYREVFARLREIEERLSARLPGSELSAVNAGAGKFSVSAGPEFLFVLESALLFAEQSGGAFDPAIGPLVRLWNIQGEDGEDGAARKTPPETDEIEAALDLVNWRDVVIDRARGTVFLRREGMALDLGGIAKGYAADEIARLLAGRQVKRAIIDLGGNIYLFGAKADGVPWRVGIQHPRAERGAIFGTLEVSANRSVVTSGVYERFFEAEGRRYHHILSTRDGRPVENGLLSVTIAAASSMEADALSTAVFALGAERGGELLAGFARNGTAAVLVFDDGSVRLTGGAAFTLENEAFRLAEPDGLRAATAPRPAAYAGDAAQTP
jgi:thiamine biosynthesis lipoprotein